MGRNDRGPVVGTTSGWKGHDVTIFTVVSIFTGEATTAASFTPGSTL